MSHDNSNGRPPSPDKVNTLILKGGGVKALSFAGAIKVLDEAGYKFKTFVGTSAGALGASLLAAGYTADELKDALAAKDLRDLLDTGPFRAAIRLVIHGGLYKGDKLTEWVGTLLRERFDDVRYPRVTMRLFDSARDGEERKRAIIIAAHPIIGTLTFDSKGENRDTEVAHAVRLSSSIPGFFVPEKHDGRRIYDGGLLHNFPIDVYRRIKQAEDGPANGHDDFIALYIGHPAGEEVKPKWWFREAMSIMLARDDIINLQNDRSVILDTDPIRTTDFDLTKEEKAFLVKVGEAAALDFLQDDRAKAAQDDLEDVRKKVKSARTRRKIRKRAEGVSKMAILIAGLVVLVILLMPREQYLVPSSVRYKDTYVSTGSVIKRLGDKAIQELEDAYLQYHEAFADDSCRFDSVVQIVLSDATCAIKLVVYDGAFDGKAGLVKVTASNDEDGTVTAGGFLFKMSGDSWQPLEGCKWVDQDNATAKKVEKHLDLNDCTQKGQHLRFVLIASYKAVFGPKSVAEPWILMAHRFLNDDGEATYLFLGDPVATIKFPSWIYEQNTAAKHFNILEAPRLSMNTTEGWERIGPLIKFLRTESVRQTVDKDLLADLDRVLERFDSEETLFKDNVTDRDFLFTFDAKETKELDKNLDVLNIVVFVENLAPRPDDGEPESPP